MKREKNRKKNKVTVVIVVIILVIMAGLVLASCFNVSEPGAVVTTTTPIRSDIKESVDTSGTVVSEEEVVIFASVGGTLAEVNVTLGDAVNKGDVLLTYDMEEAELLLQQAKLQQGKSEAGYNAALSDSSKRQAELNEANINLAVLEQQLKDYKAHLTRLQNDLSESLRSTGNALADESYDLTCESNEIQNKMKALDKTAPDYAQQYAQLQEDLEDISEEIAYNQLQKTTYSSSDYVAEMEKEIAATQDEITRCEKYKAEMQSQKATGENGVLSSYDKKQFAADKELANLNYEQAERDYAEAQKGVTAQFNGIVTEVDVVSGATITGGTRLFKLSNSEKLKVTFQASKRDVEKLEEGQDAVIKIAGNEYKGKVSKINRIATVNESNTPMVGVEIHISNPDDKIILGLDAKVEILTGQAKEALLIPVEVINADKDGDFLYVVEDGIIVRKPIACGISSDAYAEVLEGLVGDEQIVVTSLTEMEEGMLATVMPQQ